MIITEQKRKRINIYFKAFILLVILVGIPLYFYFFQRDFITQFTSVSDIENYLTEHKSTGVFTYIGAQIIQIIICVIPGQPFQFAAGYVNLKWGPFIIISSIARMPAMMGSILVGTFTKTHNYELVAVLVIAVIILTLLCLKNKQRILDWSDRVYDKLSHLKY